MSIIYIREIFFELLFEVLDFSLDVWIRIKVIIVIVIRYFFILFGNEFMYGLFGLVFGEKSREMNRK